MVEFVGLRTRLKPGMEEAYEHMAPYVVVADDRRGAATDRLRPIYAG